MTLSKGMFVIFFMLSSIVAVTVVPVHYTDPGLAHYEEVYQAIVKDVCPNGLRDLNPQFIMGFKDLEYPTIGVTYRSSFRTSIWIDNTYWKNAKEADRLAVVFHEFAHGLLYMGHSEDINNYMFPSAFPILLPDLFNQVRKDIALRCK